MDDKWAAYYAEKGEELNERRRSRYETDAEYRKKILEGNAEYRRRRKRAEKREKAKKRKSVRMERTESQWKTVQMEVDGVTMPMFTIGALARALGRGISTCRVWEREGVLPETPHRSPKGDRLYTADDVAKIERQLKREGKLPRERRKLLSKVKPDYVDRVVRFADGESRTMRLYKVGTLAQAVDRTVVSLTQMEKSGRLPITPLRASSIRYRLYTPRMIEAVRDAFKRHGGSIRGDVEWREFYAEIREDWESQGVIGARVMEKADGNQNEVSERGRSTQRGVLREARASTA